MQQADAYEMTVRWYKQFTVQLTSTPKCWCSLYHPMRFPCQYMHPSWIRFLPASHLWHVFSDKGHKGMQRRKEVYGKCLIYAVQLYVAVMFKALWLGSSHTRSHSPPYMTAVYFNVVFRQDARSHIVFIWINIGVKTGLEACGLEL